MGTLQKTPPSFVSGQHELSPRGDSADLAGQRDQGVFLEAKGAAQALGGAER